MKSATSLRFTLLLSASVFIVISASGQQRGPDRVEKFQIIDAEPSWLAFDGTDIWVGTTSDGTTMLANKMRPSDGTILGTFPTMLENMLHATFDGTNLWIIDIDSTVSKIRASDGAYLGSFNTHGMSQRGLVSDGTYLWVAHYDYATVSQLQVSDGAWVRDLDGGSGASAIAFDGANLWVTNELDDIVQKFRASDGTFLGQFEVGNFPKNVLFDGDNIWVANLSDSTLTKLRAEDGTLLGTFDAGRWPFYLAFDGRNIWTSVIWSVAQLNARTGLLQNKYPGGFARDLIFAAGSIWDSQPLDRTVLKLTPGR